ncbi:MAG: DUF2306 domain-containing protein [Actinomycetota bacterium]
MDVAVDVLVVYAALAVWAVTTAVSVHRGDARPFVVVGVLIMLGLNVRYFVEGQPAAIASFVGIYDVFDNLGLSADEGAPALATCVDNACTVWGDRYLHHPAWGVAFYERFLDAPQLRTSLLYGHIFFNSIAFVLMHHQLLPTGRVGAERHRLIGRITFGSMSIGTVLAVWLATEHGDVDEYGGILSTLGFLSMSAFVFLTALAGVRAARAGDLARHRRWMIRFIGAMWGSFWLFRVMLVVTGPALRSFETVSIQLSIWLSAPLGILIAERLLLRRPAKRADVDAEPVGATTGPV